MKITYKLSVLSPVLTVIFVVLRLLRVIEWSWLWVLSPIPIELGLAIIYIIIFYIGWKLGILKIE